MDIYIVHYSNPPGKFVIHVAGEEEGKEEYIDEVILKDVRFHIDRRCQSIIRERAKEMDPQKAKFPHAFGLFIEREDTMDKAHSPALVWEELEYDAQQHRTFVIKETQEKILQVKYLMIRGKETHVVR